MSTQREREREIRRAQLSWRSVRFSNVFLTTTSKSTLVSNEQVSKCEVLLLLLLQLPMLLLLLVTALMQTYVLFSVWKTLSWSLSNVRPGTNATKLFVGPLRPLRWQAKYQTDSSCPVCKFTNYLRLVQTSWQFTVDCVNAEYGIFQSLTRPSMAGRSRFAT